MGKNHKTRRNSERRPSAQDREWLSEIMRRPHNSVESAPSVMSAKVLGAIRVEEPETIPRESDTVTITRHEYDKLRESYTFVGLLLQMAKSDKSDLYTNHLLQTYAACADPGVWGAFNATDEPASD